MAWLRNPQIRWTFFDRDGWTAAVALEHPSDDIDPGNIRLIDEDIAANLQSNEELPDLTAAVRYGGDWGHVRLAGLLRKVGYDTRGTDGNEPDGSETGWGVDATSAFKLGLATAKLGVVYGKGIATYMNDGGMDLAPAVSTIVAPGNIILVPRAETVKLLGISAFVDLQWAKNWRTCCGRLPIPCSRDSSCSGDVEPTMTVKMVRIFVCSIVSNGRFRAATSGA